MFSGGLVCRPACHTGEHRFILRHSTASAQQQDNYEYQKMFNGHPPRDFKVS
jgi:hypothetical protein